MTNEQPIPIESYLEDPIHTITAAYEKDPVLAKHTTDYTIHDSQVVMAAAVVRVICENAARSKHTVLWQPPQAGKTGVAVSIINICHRQFVDAKGHHQSPGKTLNVDKYYVITGSDGKELHKQTKDRIENGCMPSVHVLRQTDLKDDIKRKTHRDLRNALVIVDESHFGTEKVENKLPEWLNAYGVDLRASGITNTYVVSVSATPNVEMIADSIAKKNYYTPPQPAGYVGIREFFNKKQLGLLEDGRQHGVTEAVDDAMRRIAADIHGNGNGILMLRINDNEARARLKLHLHKTHPHVTPVEINCEKGTIDYGHILTFAKRCLRPTTQNEVCAFLFKGAYRMGISIPDFEIKGDAELVQPTPKSPKDLTYLCYDVSDDTRATAQGLLGRFCGYRDNRFLHRNRFYVNTDAADAYAKMTDDCERHHAGLITTEELLELVPDKRLSRSTRTSANPQGEYTDQDTTTVEFSELNLDFDLDTFLTQADLKKNDVTLVNTVIDILDRNRQRLLGKHSQPGNTIVVVDNRLRGNVTDKTTLASRPDRKITVPEPGQPWQWVKASEDDRVPGHVMAFVTTDRAQRKLLVTTGTYSHKTTTTRYSESAHQTDQRHIS